MGRPGAEAGVLAKYKELLDPLKKKPTIRSGFVSFSQLCDDMAILLWRDCVGVCVHTRFTIVMSYTFSSSVLSCVFSSS